MNQKSRQAAILPVERDFFKLLNNSNFGIDYRNNIDNCILGPIYDNLGEISYIKNFTSIYNDETYRDFFSPGLMKEEIIQNFQNKIFNLNKNDPTYEARKKCYENKMEEELDSVESFAKSKNKKKRKLKYVDEKIAESLDPRKTKMVTEFNNYEAASIKSTAVKKRNNIKVTTRFMSGKLLMFAKLSLKSFIYDVIEAFCFPDENIKEIFKNYMIERVVIFHVLTDTGSTSLTVIFISDRNSDIPESKYRDMIFEIRTTSQFTRDSTTHTSSGTFLGLGKRKKEKSLDTMKLNILITHVF